MARLSRVILVSRIDVSRGGKGCSQTGVIFQILPHPLVMKLSIVFSVLMLGTGGARAADLAENLVANPSFEAGNTGWGVFVPPESLDQAPRFDVVKTGAREGGFAARLSSTGVTRFAVAPRGLIVVKEGERYRMAAWYRVEPGAVVQAGLPGVVLRANFNGMPGNTTTVSNLLIGPGSVVSSAIGRDLAVKKLAEEWTKIEAVIEIPTGVQRLGLNFFMWGLSGTLWADEFEVERVDAKTPTTPLRRPVFVQTNKSSGQLPLTTPLAAGAERLLKLPNAGFESGLTDWDNGGDDNLSRSTPEAAMRGDAGLRVEDEDKEKGSSLQSAYLPAAAGRTYRANFWARMVSGDGIAVYLRFFDAERVLLNSYESGKENLLAVPSGQASFRQFTLEAVAPPGTAVVAVWIHSYTKNVVIADFDDLSVLESQR
jgi:hypothetical protein